MISAFYFTYICNHLTVTVHDAKIISKLFQNNFILYVTTAWSINLTHLQSKRNNGARRLLTEPDERLSDYFQFTSKACTRSP